MRQSMAPVLTGRFEFPWEGWIQIERSGIVREAVIPLKTREASLPELPKRTEALHGLMDVAVGLS